MGVHSSLAVSQEEITQHSSKMVDEAKVKYICDIYDWDGKGEIDLFFLGDVCYALGLNVTKKVCVAQGQTDEEGKKFAKYDDVVEKVKAAVATPDPGNIRRLPGAAQALRQEQQRHHDAGRARQHPLQPRRRGAQGRCADIFSSTHLSYTP